MSSEREQVLTVRDGIRSAAVVVDGSRASARVRVPRWATIVRVRLAGGASVGGDPGDVLEGVMSVRAGTSLRVALGAAGSADHPDGGPTTLQRDGVATVSAAGGSDGARRGRSRPGPLWDVRMGAADQAGRGAAEFEFIGPDVERRDPDGEAAFAHWA